MTHLSSMCDLTDALSTQYSLRYTYALLPGQPLNLASFMFITHKIFFNWSAVLNEQISRKSYNNFIKLSFVVYLGIDHMQSANCSVEVIFWTKSLTIFLLMTQRRNMNAKRIWKGFREASNFDESRKKNLCNEFG